MTENDADVSFARLVDRHGRRLRPKVKWLNASFIEGLNVAWQEEIGVASLSNAAA